jgi:hypothetical protein
MVTVFVLELIMRMTTHWAYALVLMSPMVLAEIGVRVRVAGSDGESLSVNLAFYRLDGTIKGIIIRAFRNIYISLRFLSGHQNILRPSRTLE